MRQKTIRVDITDPESGEHLGQLKVEVQIDDNTYPGMERDGFTKQDIENGKKERWRKVLCYSQIAGPGNKQIHEGELGFDWL